MDTTKEVIAELKDIITSLEEDDGFKDLRLPASACHRVSEALHEIQNRRDEEEIDENY